jgi:hypothetical protein
MSERNRPSISSDPPAQPGMVEFLSTQDHARSCPASSGQSLNGALREIVRLFAQIVVDDLFDEQGDEAVHPTFQQSAAGPFGQEKEDV